MCHQNPQELPLPAYETADAAGEKIWRLPIGDDGGETLIPDLEDAGPVRRLRRAERRWSGTSR